MVVLNRGRTHWVVFESFKAVPLPYLVEAFHIYESAVVDATAQVGEARVPLWKWV